MPSVRPTGCASQLPGPGREVNDRTPSAPRANITVALVGLYTTFSNIFENIEGPAHFHIREYSREHRCPGRLFPQEYTSFPQPLTLVDLESKDILEYS